MSTMTARMSFMMIRSGLCLGPPTSQSQTKIKMIGKSMPGNKKEMRTTGLIIGFIIQSKMIFELMSLLLKAPKEDSFKMARNSDEHKIYLLFKSLFSHKQPRNL